MSVCGTPMRMIAGGLAAFLALASAVPAVAQPITTSPAVLRLAPRDSATPVPRRGVRVPPGILAGVATGSIPGGARLRTYYPPYPVGFAADPYYSPPAVVVAPPPIVFASPPFLYNIAPVWLPFDGGCFVQSDFAGQHGYFGSCAESLFQQWISRPY